MAYIYNNIEDRLKNYIEKTESCWNWTGYKNEHGYGLITIGRGKQKRAHRYMYERYIGNIPDGMKVLHSCDNPQCVNPNHLSIGTQKDNVKDMMNRKRGGYKKFCGEAHHNKKLSFDNVNTIREMWGTGQYLQKQLAKKFGVSQQVISKVVNYKAWLENGSYVISNKQST